MKSFSNGSISPQVVLKRSIVDAISTNPDYKEAVEAHKAKHPTDPLPIPFSDPEPQLMIGYNDKTKYHVQIHRDAFSYGDVGPRADPRVILDFRFFGKQDVSLNNYVGFSEDFQVPSTNEWRPGVTDKYGMPQPTVRKAPGFRGVRSFSAHDGMCSSTSKGLLPTLNVTRGS